MTRTFFINLIAALTLFISPLATAHEALNAEHAIPLEPLYTAATSSLPSFFEPKSADEIQDLIAIDEQLEESLVWEKGG